MGNKIRSEITRIDLTEASYKGTRTFVEPTYVNFFFGNNGTGKSTVAKAIQNGTGITYASSRAFEDYIPLVYNQAFIDGNFSSYRNMPGVFTLNAKNDATQKKIDEEKLQLASSMLAYINASSIGMDYVEECLNASECRNIFEMIFTSMNQKQHYDMMMGADNQ